MQMKIGCQTNYHLEYGRDSRAEQKRKVIALLECRRQNEAGAASGSWKMCAHCAAVVVDGEVDLGQGCPRSIKSIIYRALSSGGKLLTGWIKRVERRLDTFATIHCSSAGGNSVTKLMAPSTHASACPKHSLARAT